MNRHKDSKQANGWQAKIWVCLGNKLHASGLNPEETFPKYVLVYN